jgi:soluble lytic murein transglycosylase
MAMTIRRPRLLAGLLAVAFLGVAAVPVFSSLTGPEESAGPAAVVGVAEPVNVPRLTVALGDAAPSEIDPISTGSISGTGTDSVRSIKGSADFRKTLQVLDEGDAAAAYALAKSLPDHTERRALQWAAIHGGNGAIDPDSVLRFMADAPEFAVGSVFQTRFEQALVRSRAGADALIAELGGAGPKTVEAQLALAAAYLEDGQRDRAAAIVGELWTGKFLDRGTEERILKRFGELLDREAHWDRAVHLMMHDRATGVERIMHFLSPGQKSLAVARNAVSRNAKNAKALLDKVDPAFTDHPVFLYSRAQRARQFELWDDAVAWLNKASGEVPDAAEWWYERRRLTRQLLALEQYELAYEASAGYQHGSEGRLVDARFHAGWIALAFLDRPQDAAEHFEAMREVSTLPDSVTQSNYWLGRAKLALGDKLGANEAYARAARYSTVYYGQLARAELGMGGVQLREMPDWQQSQPAFEAQEIVRAVRLFAESGRDDLAAKLLKSFAHDLQDGGQLLLAARLAQELNAHDLAIQIADTADRRGMPLDLFSFPKDGLPTVRLAAVDVAAVYAVTRQESHFRADAVSSAGARGLMQLMPATAKETAEKVGESYSPGRLTSDPAYNALLGSTYLAAQLQRYDGSLLLAAAAYNAGAGNANKWIKAFGDPRDEDVDPVVWVEQIPFHETRKYVQRVLGNYLVYRARLGAEQASALETLRRLPA